ncbi:hypothetical protein A2780_03940 [Candidatus Daviesbacteria bacterium RIFCSPHIGHO2_01_FULL_41_45]|uniref:Uncharacterized protein n=1 Tax=Candidatus Yanofskybacteria bacterium RIFCSPLOWO2_02_FULL_45_10 TaxID=1802706 RepID=A0A1F8H5U4_9BACT|nr:MAG: hypothetical protein A2780_03940 [Candidatus Daviesbacteria bacterium RIFCSPHIGHO2_01_FULL_41_45]OGN32955.1 MAG: hypothetical protein A3I32_01395 [Candidatus Yanofskybacteria bacterium RIFCSPLOWO2_02_FULL_45_10]HCR81763.1 hypothetical protein [Candidatus Paceibacterota bacterium]
MANYDGNEKRKSIFDVNQHQLEMERQAEAKEIAERIGDPRLRTDEHLEYFTLELKDGVRHVPKRSHHLSSDSNDKTNDKANKEIEARLREILAKEPQL